MSSPDGGPPHSCGTTDPRVSSPSHVLRPSSGTPSTRLVQGAESHRDAAHGRLEGGRGWCAHAGHPRALPGFRGAGHGDRRGDRGLPGRPSRAAAARYLRGSARRGTRPNRGDHPRRRRHGVDPAASRREEHEPREHFRGPARCSVGRAGEGAWCPRHSPRTASSASWAASPRQRAAPRMRVSTRLKSTVPTGTWRVSSCRPWRTRGRTAGAGASETAPGSCAKLPGACAPPQGLVYSSRAGSAPLRTRLAASPWPRASRSRSGSRKTACRSSTSPPESAGAPKLGPEDGQWSDRLLLGAAVRTAVGIPVIGIGGIRTPGQAEQALSEGLVDLVGVGRAMLADPKWAEKTLGNREADIFLCRQCRVCHHFRYAERCPARKDAALSAGAGESAPGGAESR